MTGGVIERGLPPVEEPRSYVSSISKDVGSVIPVTTTVHRILSMSGDDCSMPHVALNEDRGTSGNQGNEQMTIDNTSEENSNENANKHEGQIEPSKTDSTAGEAQAGCPLCSSCGGGCYGSDGCKNIGQGRSRMDHNENGVKVIRDERCSDDKNTCVRKSSRLLLSGFFMIGVTGLSIADIATDVLTAREYYLTDRVTAFILSLVFLVIPPILLTAGIIRRRDDQAKNSESPTHCGIKFLIFIANVPLKLYMIWLQMMFSVMCFKRFHRWRVSKCKTQEKRLLEGSFSHFVTELTLYKLWNSIFESVPQLLLTINVIMTTPSVLTSSEGYILIASSIFSFGSLCVGIIFYSITSKEAESEPASSNVVTHPLRSKGTVLGYPQIFFMSVYTVCFLCSRIVSFSYFIIFFEWFAVIVPGLHFIAVLAFFSHRRYINNLNAMHHYRMKAYQRQSSSFVYVLVHSTISVFVHIKPECEELLDQPRYFKIIYYLFYTAENCVMVFMPLLLKGIWPKISDDSLEELKYYPMCYATLGAMGLGAVTCAFYHLIIHKAAQFTREEVFGPCCKCCYGPGGFLCFSCSCCCGDIDDSKVFVTCKNIHTHEIQKTSVRDMKRWKQSTESKLLNKRRKWKLLQNAFVATKALKDGGKQSEENRVSGSESKGLKNASRDKTGSDPDCPYTMRRTGLHILSDPKGNLFYAPIAAK